MFRQPKYQSILVFALCLLGVVLALLLSTLDWLEWHISVTDHSPANYRIGMTSQLLTTSEYLTDDFFPYFNVIVYSPQGQCLEAKAARWEVSASDRLKERWIVGLFDFAVFLRTLSLVMLVLAFINLLWRWWEKASSILLIVFLTVLIPVMRLLGPRISIHPDFSGYDFDCVYSSVAIKAELLSVNLLAPALFALIVLIEAAAIVMLLRSLFAKFSKESHGNDIVNV